MTIAEIEEMMHSMKEEQAQIIEDVGSDYANVAKADNYFSIAPKAIKDRDWWFFQNTPLHLEKALDQKVLVKHRC